MNEGFSGGIEVICGPMFSGKTEELVRRLKRARIARQKVQVFKPLIDNRYSGDHVESHDATRVPCIPVAKAGEILDLVADNVRVVAIDEAQFFDQSVVQVTQKLAFRGVRVLIAGLDMDYRGRAFGPIPELLSVAESVSKLTAICQICGSPATRSQRLKIVSKAAKPNADEAIVLVGGSEAYEPRCRHHHEPEPVERDLRDQALTSRV